MDLGVIPYTSHNRIPNQHLGFFHPRPPAQMIQGEHNTIVPVDFTDEELFGRNAGERGKKCGLNYAQAWVLTMRCSTLVG